MTGNINVRALLHEVCALIMDRMDVIQEKRYEVTIKPDGTPVTNADMYIESLVHEYIKTNIPGAFFIGEESYQIDSEGNHSGTMIILDPIDGTENFCSGLPEWGVSFGIWHEGEHLGSFLLMPELGIRLMTGDLVNRVPRSRITGLSSSMSDAVLNQLSNPGEFRIMGCAVYNIYNVIRGAYKRFVNPKGAYVWDLLPGIMLALEHGCRVVVEGDEYRGKNLDPNKKYRIDIQRP